MYFKKEFESAGNEHSGQWDMQDHIERILNLVYFKSSKYYPTCYLHGKKYCGKIYRIKASADFGNRAV